MGNSKRRCRDVLCYSLRVGPYSSTFLACDILHDLVLDSIEDSFAGLGVFGFTDLRADIDEECPFEFPTLVPTLKLVADLVIVHSETFEHDAPCLGDSTHHAMFDAVVNHLDVVTGTASACTAYARLAVRSLCGDLLQKRHDDVESLVVGSGAH